MSVRSSLRYTDFSVQMLPASSYNVLDSLIIPTGSDPYSVHLQIPIAGNRVK